MATAILHSIHQLDSLVGAAATTVRRGPKWYDEPAQEIDLCYCQGDDHQVVGKARIMYRMLMPFNQLTNGLIADEHEESSRTVEGLLESMKRAYGDDFQETDQVTVLSYWRTQ